MDTAVPATPRGQPAGRRSGLGTALRLAVSAALVAWILRKAPLHEVLAAFRSADLRFVLLALALNPLGYWSSVSRWRLLLRSQGGDASFGFLVRSFLVGVFFNNLLPSTIGGDAVRAVDTARSGVSRAAAVAIVFVDRFLGLLALMLFAAVGLLVSGRLTERVPALQAWVAAGAVAMGLLAGLLFLPSARGAVLLERLALRLPGRWRGLFGRASTAFLAFQGKGSVLARAFGWSLVLQTLVVLNGWLLAKALHVPIGLPYFFLIVPLAVFVMMVPVSINAIGVRESVWAFFFVAFGVAGAKAVALAWLDYGLVLLQALAGGAVYAWGRRPASPSLPVEEAAR
jgi:glycosyltransferase 2 family protein